MGKKPIRSHPVAAKKTDEDVEQNAASEADIERQQAQQSERRARAFREGLVKLAEVLQSIDVPKIGETDLALATCVAVMRLATTNAFTPHMRQGPNAELAGRAAELGWWLIFTAQMATDGRLDAGDLAELDAVVSRSPLSNKLGARATLVLSVLGVAHIKRVCASESPPAAKDKLSRVGFAVVQSGARSIYPALFASPQTDRARTEDDDAVSWPLLVRVQLTWRGYHDASERLSYDDLSSAIESLSQPARIQKQGRWQTLSELVKKAGLGRIAPESLRNEMNRLAP